MKLRLNGLTIRLIAVGLVVLAYFVVFPGDIRTLLAPAESLARGIADPVATLLDVTGHVSPWLYGLAAVAVIAWTIVRVRGGRTGRAA